MHAVNSTTCGNQIRMSAHAKLIFMHVAISNSELSVLLFVIKENEILIHTILVGTTWGL
jgi:hypothetical protein